MIFFSCVLKQSGENRNWETNCHGFDSLFKAPAIPLSDEVQEKKKRRMQNEKGEGEGKKGG